MAIRVLLVDDDQAVLRSLGEALVDMGVELRTAPCAEDALRAVADQPPDLVLSDIRMPGLGGLELLPGWRCARGGPGVGSSAIR
jgi:DNA-binding NtrC family response regulator